MYSKKPIYTFDDETSTEIKKIQVGRIISATSFNGEAEAFVCVKDTSQLPQDTTLQQALDDGYIKLLAKLGDVPQGNKNDITDAMNLDLYQYDFLPIYSDILVSKSRTQELFSKYYESITSGSGSGVTYEQWVDTFNPEFSSAPDLIKRMVVSHVILGTMFISLWNKTFKDNNIQKAKRANFTHQVSNFSDFLDTGLLITQKMSDTAWLENNMYEPMNNPTQMNEDVINAWKNVDKQYFTIAPGFPDNAYFPTLVTFFHGYSLLKSNGGDNFLDAFKTKFLENNATYVTLKDNFVDYTLPKPKTYKISSIEWNKPNTDNHTAYVEIPNAQERAHLDLYIPKQFKFQWDDDAIEVSQQPASTDYEETEVDHLNLIYFHVVYWVSGVVTDPIQTQTTKSQWITQKTGTGDKNVSNPLWRRIVGINEGNPYLWYKNQVISKSGSLWDRNTYKNNIGIFAHFLRIGAFTKYRDEFWEAYTENGYKYKLKESIYSLTKEQVIETIYKILYEFIWMPKATRDSLWTNKIIATNSEYENGKPTPPEYIEVIDGNYYLKWNRGGCAAPTFVSYTYNRGTKNLNVTNNYGYGILPACQTRSDTRSYPNTEIKFAAERPPEKREFTLIANHTTSRTWKAHYIIHLERERA